MGYVEILEYYRISHIILRTGREIPGKLAGEEKVTWLKRNISGIRGKEGKRQASSHRSFNRRRTSRSLPRRVAPVLAKTGPRLLAAQSPEEIVRAVREDAPGITASLVQFSELILQVLRDPKFPHARPASQIHFLADSLGGRVL